jgi:K+-sensing histidine kinase KdpD
VEDKRAKAYKKQKILLELISRLNNAEKPDDILSALAPKEVDILLPEEIKGAITLALEHLRILKNTEQASHEWRMTFDAITDPILITDENFTIVKANKEWAKIAEKDFKKIKGLTCHEIFANSQTPCPSCMERNPCNIKIKDREFLCWVSTIKNLSEKLYVHYYRDVSNEKELYKILIEKQKLALIGSLVDGVVNELNAPLNKILKYSEEIFEEFSDEDERKEFINDIKEATVRCKNILANLLDYSNTKKLGVSTVIDLNSIIVKTLPLADAALHKVKVILDHCPDTIIINCDLVKLKQPFLKIIMNAAEAMNASGSGILTITSNKKNDCYAEITFKDTGSGISEETLSRVFEPFFSTKTKQGGTGLGLYLTREIILVHQGEISINSEPGKGTNISITIPICCN